MKAVIKDSLISGSILGFILGISGLEIGYKSTTEFILYSTVFSLLSCLYYFFISRERKCSLWQVVVFGMIFFIAFAFMCYSMWILLILGV